MTKLTKSSKNIIVKLALVGLCATTLVASSATNLFGALGGLAGSGGTELGQANPSVVAFALIATPNTAPVGIENGLQPSIKEALADGQTLNGSKAYIGFNNTPTPDDGGFDVSLSSNAGVGAVKFSTSPAGGNDYFLSINHSYYFDESDKTVMDGMYADDKGTTKSLNIIYSKLHDTPYSYADIVMSARKDLVTSQIRYGTYGVDTVNMHMPIAGNATYKGETFVTITPANYADERDTYRGDVELYADFATSKINGTISNIKSTSEIVEGKLLVQSGTITNNHRGVIDTLGTGNKFVADVVGDATMDTYLDEHLYGKMEGRFYGGQASETAGIITLKSTGGQEFRGAGAFIAKK